MASVRPIWRVIDRSVLVARSWGNDHVLYNCASGDTHLLNPVAARVLELLAERPSDVLTLTSRLAATLDVSAEALDVVATERLLAKLDELGVVESVRS